MREEERDVKRVEDRRKVRGGENRENRGGEETVEEGIGGQKSREHMREKRRGES